MDAFAFPIVFSIYILIETYVPCYFGSRLLYKRDRLAEKAFHLNWIGRNERFKRFLLILGQGVQMPIPVAANGLFRLDLTTFSAVNKAIVKLTNPSILPKAYFSFCLL